MLKDHLVCLLEVPFIIANWTEPEFLIFGPRIHLLGCIGFKSIHKQHYRHWQEVILASLLSWHCPQGSKFKLWKISILCSNDPVDLSPGFNWCSRLTASVSSGSAYFGTPISQPIHFWSGVGMRTFLSVDNNKRMSDWCRMRINCLPRCFRSSYILVWRADKHYVLDKQRSIFSGVIRKYYYGFIYIHLSF